MPHSGAAFLAGPLALLFLLAALAGTFLVCAWFRHVSGLRTLWERARTRCERGPALTMLWGISAGALVFAVSALLIQTHVLALFGVALLLCGLVGLSLGLGVAAWIAGDALAVLMEGDGGMPQAFRLGVGVLLLASCLPYVGWLLCLLLVASGTGAVLETLLGRE